MAGLFTEQAAVYAAARPAYPKDLFAKLAALTSHHRRAWDVGTGNGQAAIGVAEHYDSVVATDVDAEQLRHATPHPKVQYLHTPDAAPTEDLVSTLGGEGSVDLITVAQAVHWFDLPAFYGVARRALRRPGGVIAVRLGLQLQHEPRGGHDDTLRQHHTSLLGPPSSVLH